MTNAILFLLGFSSVVGVYEIAKTSKRSSTAKLEKAINTCKKMMK